MAAAAAMATGTGSEGGRSEEAEEDEVEEQLVMVELSGIIDSGFLEKCENKCKILGIETERPILQVDRYVFAGEYEDTLGTCVVFEENAEHVDAEGNQKVQLKYKCHTVKKLNMTRTLLTEKKEGEENVGSKYVYLNAKVQNTHGKRREIVLSNQCCLQKWLVGDSYKRVEEQGKHMLMYPGGVEWLQIKERDFSYSRPNMICSFMREKDDSEESGQAQDKLTEESEGEVSGEGNSDMNCDLEKQHTLEVDASVPLPDSPASGAEESPSGNIALEDVPS